MREEVLILIGVWFIGLNGLGAVLMVSDKNNAKKGQWRVKESVLFIVAALGGAIAMTLAMHTVRHKTRKFFFRYGLPALIWLNVLTYLAVLLFCFGAF